MLASNSTTDRSDLRQGLAATFCGPRDIAIVKSSFHSPRAREVSIRVEGCGICGSNLPAWEGRPWFEYPFKAGHPGHEGWGTIDAVGSDVHELSVGDRVTMLSYHAFSNYDIVDANHVIPLPQSLDGIPLPGEAIGCAMNVFARCAIQPGQHVAVVGVGFLGALLIQLAANSKARVLAVSRRNFGLEIARQSGAEIAVSSTHYDVGHVVQRWTNGRGCDCVIEATGFQHPLELASKFVKTRGRLVIAGFHQDGLRTVDLQSWNWRGIDVINAHERDPQVYLEGMRKGVDALVLGKLSLKNLLTHQFPLIDMRAAMEIAGERPDGFLKAWVNCSSN